MSIDWFGKKAKKQKRLAEKEAAKAKEGLIRIQNEKMEKEHPCKGRDEHCWHYLDSCLDFMWRFRDYCCFCDGVKTIDGDKISSITLGQEHGKFLPSHGRKHG